MRALNSFILYGIYFSTFFQKFDEVFPAVARFWNVRLSFVSHFKRAHLGIFVFTLEGTFDYVSGTEAAHSNF